MLLDSVCSNHMTGDKKWFIELDDSFRETVKLEKKPLKWMSRERGTSEYRFMEKLR